MQRLVFVFVHTSPMHISTATYPWHDVQVKRVYQCEQVLLLKRVYAGEHVMPVSQHYQPKKTDNFINWVREY